MECNRSRILNIWDASVAENKVFDYLWHPDRAHQNENDKLAEVYLSQVNGDQEPEQRDIALGFLDPRKLQVALVVSKRIHCENS